MYNVNFGYIFILFSGSLICIMLIRAIPIRHRDREINQIRHGHIVWNGVKKHKNPPMSKTSLTDGNFIVYHYIDSTFEKWKYKNSWLSFSYLCALHNCTSVIISGNCGFNGKMCKRLTFQGLAMHESKQTVFVDNDIVANPNKFQSVFDICGDKPFSIGCRFKHTQNLTRYQKQHSTNSGVMCLDTTKMDSDILEKLASIGRCHNRSRWDQLPFFKLYHSLWQNKQIHCLNEDKYANRHSSNWVHYWGSEKYKINDLNITERLKKKMEIQNISKPKTVVLELRPHTLQLQKSYIINWQMNGTWYKTFDKNINVQLLENGIDNVSTICKHKALFTQTTSFWSKQCLECLS